MIEKGLHMTIPRLANAELAVMERLWMEGRLTARRLCERLYPDTTRSAHGTIQRLLQRLENKGFVERDRSLGTQIFSPRIGREAYASARLEALADRITGGSLVPMITQLMEERKLSPEEIERLREILENG